MGLKVAILGTVSYTKMMAPFRDGEWEIWVCSPGNRGQAIPRVTRWFELHGVEDMKGEENANWRADYFAWLNAQAFPVYMQEPNDLCPQAKVFPIKKMLDEFGRFGRMSFTSSISLMIGLAILEKAEEIAVYGVNMEANSEAYSGQKAGCLNMMWLADQRGIKVTVPLESSLATLPPLYGYAEASRMGRSLVIREIEQAKAISDLDATILRLQLERAQFQGALETTRYMLRTFVDGELDAEIDPEPAKVEAISTKGTETYRTGDLPTRIPHLGNGFDGMEVEKVGSVFVPKGFDGGERHAEE